MEEIILPYAINTWFSIQDLVNHFKTEKINYLIIGATQVTLDNHPKIKSLDVWIRKNHCPPGYENTCQAVNKVISQLIKHESFSLGLRKCPKSNRICKALVFCDSKK
jgi:hypothetical protein